MELIIIIFVVWGCYALFSRANKKTPPNKQSQEPRNEEVLNKRDVQVRSEPDDDELATFTISVSTSYGGQETKSNNKTKQGQSLTAASTMAETGRIVLT